MSFFENTRKPVGFGGKLMVTMMNLGHSPVTRWGLRFLELAPDATVLDCGCGGANIRRLLKKCPQGIVKGIDYSPVSVEKSKKVNEAAIAEGRCAVLQGSVADMMFADNWFDAVTAFETVYFWSDLTRCFCPGDGFQSESTDGWNVCGCGHTALSLRSEEPFKDSDFHIYSISIDKTYGRRTITPIGIHSMPPF